MNTLFSLVDAAHIDISRTSHPNIITPTVYIKSHSASLKYITYAHYSTNSMLKSHVNAFVCNHNEYYIACTSVKLQVLFYMCCAATVKQPPQCAVLTVDPPTLYIHDAAAPQHMYLSLGQYGTGKWRPGSNKLFSRLLFFSEFCLIFFISGELGFISNLGSSFVAFTYVTASYSSRRTTVTALFNRPWDRARPDLAAHAGGPGVRRARGRLEETRASNLNWIELNWIEWIEWI